MKKILVFGGTSEGRKISETLSRNKLRVHVSVATDYGRQVLEENAFLKILEGRMDSSAMKELYRKENYDLVIDATHPFAKEVSENIKNSSSETNLPLIRFEREIKNLESKDLVYTENAIQCVDALLNTTGKILLTTGSKDLKVFCEKPELRERIIARVLPAMESLKLCYENNLEGKQIIAMQGPFSENMNINQIEEYGISVLVTKESGKAGGTDSKISASLKKGIKCIVIKNSSVGKTTDEFYGNYTKCSSLDELYTLVENKLNIKISESKKMTVNLKPQKKLKTQTAFLALKEWFRTLGLPQGNILTTFQKTLFQSYKNHYNPQILMKTHAFFLAVTQDFSAGLQNFKKN